MERFNAMRWRPTHSALSPAALTNFALRVQARHSHGVEVWRRDGSSEQRQRHGRAAGAVNLLRQLVRHNGAQAGAEESVRLVAEGQAVRQHARQALHGVDVGLALAPPAPRDLHRADLDGRWQHHGPPAGARIVCARAQ